MCKGCGTCVAACPAGVITGAHFNNQQILAEIRGALWDALTAAAGEQMPESEAGPASAVAAG
jgi:heterodisulfide reductase subunit A